MAQEDKEKIAIERTISFKQILHLLIIFASVQFLGIALYSILIKNGPELIVGSNVQKVSATDMGLFFVYILAASAAIIFITKKTSKVTSNKIILIMDAMMVVTSASFGFGIILSLFLTNVQPLPFVVLIYGLALLSFYAKRKWPELRNYVTIMAISSAGVILSLMFDMNSILIFFGILSVYDLVSVFVTKHMIQLANAVTAQPTSFTVASQQILPKKNFKEIEISPSTKNPPIAVSRVELGGGDLLIPLVFSLVSFKATLSFTSAVVVAIFACGGLIATLAILIRYRRPLPALPPLFVSSLIGYFLITLLGI